ncbi:glycoside hydrolase family 6 protein [Streptomyces niveus]
MKKSSMRAAAAALVPCFCAVIAVLAAAPAATANATGFYANPDSQVNQWVNANPNDGRAAAIRSKIADVPRSTWFASYDANASSVTASVKKVTDGAANAGRTASVVAYMIPNRDCGDFSAGGAPTYAAYDQWIRAFANGLGSREVVVLLEPDAIVKARGSECQGANLNVTERLTALKNAGAAIKATAPNAKVYYDAGHSGWKSTAADLISAGVVQYGAGIVSNVSNFRTTEDEVGFGKTLLNELGNSSLGLIVDTGRNGNGPTADAQWCNPAGRALGKLPTTDTGDPRVHAFLWVKQPGESDGYCGWNGAQAGQFVPDLANELAQNTR